MLGYIRNCNDTNKVCQQLQYKTAPAVDKMQSYCLNSTIHTTNYPDKVKQYKHEDDQLVQEYPVDYPILVQIDKIMEVWAIRMLQPLN